MTSYQKRISGPLLDRIDIHVEVPRVDYDKLSEQTPGRASRAIRAAGGGRRARPDASALPGTQLMTCNADMGPAEVRKYCDLDDTGRALMKAAMSQLQLTARAYHRVLKLARTIADLAGSETIEPGTWPRRCSTARNIWCRCEGFISFMPLL